MKKCKDMYKFKERNKDQDQEIINNKNNKRNK
jgi:hypothetical protein